MLKRVEGDNADRVVELSDIKSEMRYSRYSVFSGCGMIGSTMRESRCGS
jgi:hypothetical protein